MRRIASILALLLMMHISSASPFALPRYRLVMGPLLKNKSGSLISTFPRRDSSKALCVRGGGNIIRTIRSSKKLCWIALALAIANEIYSTTLLAISQKERNWVKLGTAISLYVMSLLIFAMSLAQIDTSIAYAVWSACGTAFVSAIGIVFFGEQVDGLKIGCLALIVSGVIGLNVREFLLAK